MKNEGLATSRSGAFIGNYERCNLIQICLFNRGSYRYERARLKVAANKTNYHSSSASNTGSGSVRQKRVEVDGLPRTHRRIKKESAGPAKLSSEMEMKLVV